jgi:L-alanine-DL-glutamate epimerase-like enolase superfamily enzyme
VIPLRILRVELARTPCRTRLPFRFGAVTVREADLLTCRVRADTGGVDAQGWSADLLVPRWFRKDIAREPVADAAALEACAREAARAFVAATAQPTSVHAAWHEVFSERVTAEPEGAPYLLERGFGVALIERALLDAACRAAELPFAQALRRDLFGAGVFDASPHAEIEVRHTVGMLDLLRASEIPPEQRVNDGLPQALEEDIAAYGLRRFKIKIGAGHAQDRERLLALARLFADLDLDPRVTLDGNEQFESLDALAELLEAVRTEPEGARLLARLDFIEQPLPRARTCEDAANRGLARVTDFAPLVLDEADARSDALARAAACGWSGVSVKNCKGTLRALEAARFCAARGGSLFQTSEDLTNLPVLSLQQDLCTATALGLAHAERNGHHYFHGLDHLPTALQREALTAHPDLYRPLGAGAALRIEGGRLRCASAVGARGYGHHLADHAESFATVAEA